MRDQIKCCKKLQEIERSYIYGNHTFWRVHIASLLGEKEQAVRLIRDSLKQGLSYSRLHADMDLEPLYDYSLFKEMIKPKG